MDHDNNDYEMWEWQSEDYNLQQDSNLDLSKCLWSGVRPNEDDFSSMFDEATPIKACGELDYHFSGSEISNNELEKFRETTPQTKRRRMLQFDNGSSHLPLCDEDLFSTFLRSKETDDEAFADAPQWVPGVSEDRCASGNEDLGQSSDKWLADCFNDPELQFSSDDVNLSGGSDVQIDIAEICDTPPESEASPIQERPARTRHNIAFKGRKSYMRTTPKLASSVVYPFAFIKPCGFHGDVTLNDINQRICNPPSKSKQNEEDSNAYPTSAFSGKPVVGKTKIHTDGGKGSITIMRTKG